MDLESRVRVATVGSLCVALWAALSPWGWQVAACACALGPLLLLLLLRGGQMPAAYLGICLFMAAALAWRLAQQVGFTSVTPWVVAGALGGLLLGALALKAGQARRSTLIPLLVTLAVHVGSTAAWLDVAMDFHAGSGVRPVALMATGRWGVLSPDFEVLAYHRVRLGPAATARDWFELPVPPGVARHLFIGTAACLQEHEGGLGVPWAAVHPCAGDEGITPEVAARRWLEIVAHHSGERSAVAQRLVAGDWRGLEAELGALQRRVEQGQARSDELQRALSSLHAVDPALDEPLDAWVAGAPGSYVARLARAQHAQRQSRVLLTAGFTPQVSQMLNADSRRDASLADLEAARALSPRPALNVLSQYRLEARNRREDRQWVERAIADDPNDLLMRREFLLQRPPCPCEEGTAPTDPETQWLLGTHPPTDVARALEAVRLYQRGVWFERAGRADEARRLYEAVLEHQPFRQEAYSTQINLGLAALLRRQLDEGFAHLDAAIALAPHGVHAHTARAWGDELRQDYSQALADYLVDADRGDGDAQLRAGRLLLSGAPGVPIDRAAAAKWLGAAAANGLMEARTELRRRTEVLTLLDGRTASVPSAAQE